MKVFRIIAKVVLALAAVAGALYLLATYGDKIVARCKKLLAKRPCCCGSTEGDCTCTDSECACDCECAEEVIESETAPVAAEADFEG